MNKVYLCLSFRLLSGLLATTHKLVDAMLRLTIGESVEFALKNNLNC